MIHNHEVGGSYPPLATVIDRGVYKIIVSLFFLNLSILCIQFTNKLQKTHLLKTFFPFKSNIYFHAYCDTTSDRFDLVIGNPPFIRYQYFDKAQQKEADAIFNKVKLKYSRLTNAWVSFVVGFRPLFNN